MNLDKRFESFVEGFETKAYEYMGAHLLKDNNNEIYATRFITYAPNAKEVRLISSDNYYQGNNHILDKINHLGFYSITVPKDLEWTVYKYEIHLYDGSILRKADPFAFFAEKRPSNGSIVYNINEYNWNDASFTSTKKAPYNEPVLIYEMHFGSWQQKYGYFKNYNEVCDDLINYLHSNNFTHVEFMPIYEHPLDDSWGYQGTGFFAATSRYGSPKDLMYLIDRLHQAGIYIIIDWVLGHINRDDFGISFYDGTPLYEMEDKFLRENVVWGTNNLDFTKGITKSFMTSALSFWHHYFHVDGYRIDAVSHLIYHLGDMANGYNEGAINYLKELSTHLFKLDDKLLFSAEDSTSYPKVTHPVHLGGLGFNYKWNMGYMNDTLNYFKKDPIHRKYHSELITFSMVYAYDEQFILPFSHDEVVHMKGSLVNKMPGSYYDKLANWRLLLTYYITFPGKKLLFMGQEFASFSEWNFRKELDWHLLSDEPAHQMQSRFFKDLTSIYRNYNELYQLDHNPKGFEWLIVDHTDSSVFAYSRRNELGELLVIILNMTPNYYESYEVGVPFSGTYEEILNSNKDIYAGANQYNGLSLQTSEGIRNNKPNYIKVKLGSLAAVILKYQDNRKET